MINKEVSKKLLRRFKRNDKIIYVLIFKQQHFFDNNEKHFTKKGKKSCSPPKKMAFLYNLEEALFTMKHLKKWRKELEKWLRIPKILLLNNKNMELKIKDDPLLMKKTPPKKM